jgi:hypothetical protein
MRPAATPGLEGAMEIAVLKKEPRGAELAGVLMGKQLSPELLDVGGLRKHVFIM